MLTLPFAVSLDGRVFECMATIGFHRVGIVWNSFPPWTSDSYVDQKMSTEPPLTWWCSSELSFNVWIRGRLDPKWTEHLRKHPTERRAADVHVSFWASPHLILVNNKGVCASLRFPRGVTHLLWRLHPDLIAAVKNVFLCKHANVLRFHVRNCIIIIYLLFSPCMISFDVFFSTSWWGKVSVGR